MLYDIRQTTRKIQNALSGYSHLENLIREATNTDTWGPTTKQKKQLLNWILSYSNAAIASDFYDTPVDSELTMISQSSYNPEIGKFTVDFICSRIEKYNDSNCSSTSFNAMTQKGSSLTSPYTLYSNLKKTLVTAGYEFLIITKCLILLEYLLINCYSIKGSTIQFDLTQDLKFHLGTIARLKYYHVANSYDNLNLAHEKQIQMLSEKIIKLVSNKEALQLERLKFHPSDFANINSSEDTTIPQETDYYEQQEKKKKKSTFYDEDEFEFNNHPKSSSFQLSKDKDPFGRSTISTITNNVTNYLSTPSSNNHKKSVSEGGISLNINNDFLNMPNSPTSNENQSTYRDLNTSHTDRFEDTNDLSGNNEFTTTSSNSNIEEEEVNEDEFGDFQSSVTTSTNQVNSPYDNLSSNLNHLSITSQTPRTQDIPTYSSIPMLQSSKVGNLSSDSNNRVSQDNYSLNSKKANTQLKISTNFATTIPTNNAFMTSDETQRGKRNSADIFGDLLSDFKMSPK